MSNVVKLFDERWVDGIFEEDNLSVDVSTKGNVRFNIKQEGKQSTILTMEQMARLGEVLSIAYRENDDG